MIVPLWASGALAVIVGVPCGLLHQCAQHSPLLRMLQDWDTALQLDPACTLALVQKGRLLCVFKKGQVNNRHT